MVDVELQAVEQVGEDLLQGLLGAISCADGRGGGMDNHLNGSHFGDTGHIRRFDGSWGEKKEEKVRMALVSEVPRMVGNDCSPQPAPRRAQNVSKCISHTWVKSCPAPGWRPGVGLAEGQPGGQEGPRVRSLSLGLVKPGPCPQAAQLLILGHWTQVYRQ